MPDFMDVVFCIMMIGVTVLFGYMVFGGFPTKINEVPLIAQSGVLDKLEIINQSSFVVSFQDNLSDSIIEDVTPAECQILSSAYNQSQYITINAYNINNTLSVKDISIGTAPVSPVDASKEKDSWWNPIFMFIPLSISCAAVIISVLSYSRARRRIHELSESSTRYYNMYIDEMKEKEKNQAELSMLKGKKEKAKELNSQPIEPPREGSSRISKAVQIISRETER